MTKYNLYDLASHYVSRFMSYILGIRLNSKRWYRDIYLKSPRLLAIKAIRKIFDGDICQRCHKKKRLLQLHHISYQHVNGFFWGELMDTIYVCRSCHKEIHWLD